MNRIYIFLLFVFQFHCAFLLDGLNPDKNDNNKNLLLLLFVSPAGYNWNLPPGFPTPIVPSVNPMSEAKVELGKFLFYDRALSRDQSMSCSSCHIQEFAFADAKDFPAGITGEIHPRNSQHLSNVAYHTRLTWSNPLMTNLEIQSRVPMFGATPVELGLQNNDFVNRLNANPIYPPMFQRAFGEASANEQNVRFALASFQRTMISGNSKFDQYNFRNNRAALNASEVLGMNLFNGEKAECFHCHGGFNFTDTAFHGNSGSQEFFYHSNGLHSDTYYAPLSNDKKGLFDVTGNTADIGKFRAPSLRNIGVTYPYMHDGTFMCDNAENPNITIGKTKRDCAKNALTKVIQHYESGGQTPSAKDPNLIRVFVLTATERENMVNFLLALTDEEFLTNPKFASPF
ncbi:di-heme enzyme [Leptospira congkakensis]|uniref:Di-heme enzyme n=1 Tax=Leptospira congkakensis TaxID=2484932 RepID=A0A4Z1A473_9LEPT|nr:MbnH family di-heme enzyme [Leptospira congkakensis]TGL84857.1 di-heme enzyme [Leptospira congkakensis]TGL92100.1 di-heme enzyme [Leptospira congkakensis]TGL96659.1 di-heme enzyme [Leptospira congkakensis]